ncbi:MAG: galactokinase [Phycisphaeraceae bacterium]|nr:galactokinase [Phycisphaeraceae bacterium]
MPALLTAAHPLISDFRARFGEAPALVVRAPGRVNLIGEHTDYNDGFVLPLAIDRACVAAIRARGEGEPTVISSLNVNKTKEIDLAEWNGGPAPGTPAGDWTRYVAGVIRESLDTLALPPRGFDVLLSSDVPLGGGLSSSAALEVSIATGVLSILGARLSSNDVAKLCQRAEKRFAGVPCGIMDQLASLRGIEGHCLLIDCRSLRIDPVRLPDAGRAALLVFDTGVRHALAAGEYARRRKACHAAAKALRIASLRDATLDLIEQRCSLLDEEPLRCARHVTSENARTLAAAGALSTGNLAEVGRLMLLSHASLRDGYRVSCAELDAIVDACRVHPGCFGARMTGGGFGGCAIALVMREAVPSVVEAVQSRFREAFDTECQWSEVRAAAGAEIIG